MGFVAKLFTVFVPIMLGIVFYHQRDHILGEKNNAYFEEQLSRIGDQLNHHLDSIVNQLNAFVGESKAIVGTDEDPRENELPNDEVDLKLKAKESAAQAAQRQNDKQSKQFDEKPAGSKCDLGKDLLITKQQLAGYNGEDPKKKIYLAFLGIVYDVSKGEQHYAPGGAYSMFTGKDASRAFITGDFSEAGLVDDLSGLKSESFNGVKEWSDFYAQSYRRVGRLVGAFYDQNGCPTEQVRFVEEQLEKAKQENLDEQYENELFPPCNLEYNNQKKETRFWCSKQSGGINRDWTGVPRQLFNLKNKQDFRCACIRDFGPETKNAIEYADEEEKKPETDQQVGDLNHPRVREFATCDPKAIECIVKDKK